ncbi:nucleotidyl transferase AbiEii/AbiGii toxin family protein [Bradyrhizobium sp. ARR65]|uniref:nucleotidyl transferase AbiEii/AbiGii toxin family protein n=1 Tax=Bradyrhizobium sp. ARR65 TaxID=1040989 RepID=UPI000AB26B4D|nr:nucleotidyl transferase AbiEii/AbiGii toxin family protein [Bradyrhizobium sp. ARR65]
MIPPWSKRTIGSCIASTGFQQLGYTFQLKGGTSLSKGHKIIHRFSEDIDILIEPPPDRDVRTGKEPEQSGANQNANGFL